MDYYYYYNNLDTCNEIVYTREFSHIFRLRPILAGARIHVAERIVA